LPPRGLYILSSYYQILPVGFRKRQRFAREPFIIEGKHAAPLTAADDVITFKNGVKTVAARNGLYGSFSPKPLADKPGSLLQLLKVVADSGANILSINHAREDQHSDVGACMVSMVLETRDAAHVEQIRRELTAMGYELEKE